MHHLICAILLSYAVAGCSRDTAEKFIASGKTQFANQSYRSAIIQFKNAVQKAPGNPESRYLLGVSLLETGDATSAEIELRKAASLGYAPDLVYPALVRALLQEGKPDKALLEATQHQDAPHPIAELTALSGQAYLGLRRLDEARSAFSAALVNDPTNATARLGMANLLAYGGDLAKASALVEEVLTQSPTSHDALSLHGNLLAAAGKPSEAADAYAKAIQAQPYRVGTYLQLIPLLLRERDVDRAREQTDALNKLMPRAPVALYLDALVAYTQGNIAQARDSIQQAIKSASEFTLAQLLAGMIAHDLGKYAEAADHLQKVIGAQPKMPYPRRVLISTYVRSGQIDRAREALAALLELAPGDPNTLSLAGQVALASGDLPRATDYYQKALALDPKNAALRTRLGQARNMAGDAQHAIEDLEAASVADANQYEADVALILMHLRRNDLTQAKAASARLLQKQPNNPLSFNLAGLVCVQAKDETAARNNFEHALKIQPTYFPAATNLAKLDLKDKKPDLAKQRYESILAQDGKNEQALLAMVQLLAATGAARDQIEKAIDRAISANPESRLPRLAKIQFLLESNEAKRAVSAARDAQVVMPNDAEIVLTQGRALQAAGEYDQAVAAFGNAAALAPKSPVPLMAQAQAYGAAKDWANAHQTLEKAIQLQPDLKAAHQALVSVDLHAGRFNDVIAHGLAMQKRWPKGAIGYLAQAEALIAQKDLAQAEKVLRTALAQTNNAMLAMRLHTLLRDQGRTEEAEQFAAVWAKRNPKDILLAEYVGDTDLQAKDFPNAARWYRRVLEADPNNATALNNLAWVLGQQRDPKSLEYAQKALALAPNNPSVLDTVGWLYVEAGDMNRGIELLGKANTLAPNMHPIQLNLAKALVKAGQNTAARPHLEALTKLPPESAVRQEAAKILSTL